MRHSVRWHLLISGLLVSLIAILAVGFVTLALVNRYFDQQEETYLQERGVKLIEPLEAVLRFGQPAELHQIASLGLLTNQVRVKVIDAEGRLLVDSGSFDELIPANTGFEVPDFGSAIQFFLDRRGHRQNFDPASELLLQEEFGPPVLSFTRSEPITHLSSSSIRLPLQINNQVVAYAELSEGPAFGAVIRESVQQALLVGGIVALLVAILAALISARQLTRPLQALGHASTQMADGEYSARAPESNLKEYDQLAQQFNLMAGKLAQTITSLEADRSSLKRFIADASHELRTPLTSLKTFNQLLSGQIGSHDEPRSTFIEQSAAQIALLDQLTSDLLSLSRLENRLSGTDFALGDLRLPIERAVQTNIPLSLEKKQQINVQFPADPVFFSHDAAALERAVSNIIANAVKYTPFGGTIGVSLAAEESAAFITVMDNGPGIPDEEQPLIFDRFYRGRRHKVEGSGLGLSIAQEIAAIHGGSIVVTSSPGGGALFILELPRDK